MNIFCIIFINRARTFMFYFFRREFDRFNEIALRFLESRCIIRGRKEEEMDRLLGSVHAWTEGIGWGKRDGTKERFRRVRPQRTPAASQMNPLSLLAESLGVQPRATAILTSWLTESNKKQNSESKTNHVRYTAPVTTVPRRSVLV